MPALSQATKRGLSEVAVLSDEYANVTLSNTGSKVTFRAKHSNGTEVTIDIDLDEITDNDATISSTTKHLLKRKLTLAAAEGVLAGLAADAAADDMAAVLGISQFYSLHIMNVCQGTFAPNATAAGAWYNVSDCTTQLNAKQLNMTALINSQLGDNFVDGGSITRLGGSKSLQDVMNRIPTIGIVLAVFYIVGAIFAGLSVLLTFSSVVTRSMFAKETVLANVGVSSVASLSLLVAALVLTVACKATVSSINRLGKDTIGMQAVPGTKFQSLTWAAFAMMALCMLYWMHQMHADAKAGAAKPAKKEAE